MTTTEIFKYYKTNTVFNAQNARNHISNFRLHLEWPLITKVIDTPIYVSLCIGFDSRCKFPFARFTDYSTLISLGIEPKSSHDFKKLHLYSVYECGLNFLWD